MEEHALTWRLEETCELSRAMGLSVVMKETCILRRIHSGTLLGKGWVEKVHQWIKAEDVEIVVIDGPLSSVQQKNLEVAWGCKVFDRAAVILEIFSQRARTDAGKLQVKLAQLLYQKSRIVKVWSHLERQRGGTGRGFIGGPGEKQLELDRRILEDKVMQTQKALEKIRHTRKLHRNARKAYPYIALIGYTNAGKSTLFNRMTQASVSENSRPFETLDTTARRIVLPSKRTFILSDTVGFISDLPTSLRLAFQATLEEIQEADLLLHIRDSTAPHAEAQEAEVLKVLQQMKCKVPVLDVFSKADLLSPGAVFPPDAILISAKTGEGMEKIFQGLDTFFHEKSQVIVFFCEEYSMVHWLYEHSHVLSVKTKERKAGRTKDSESIIVTQVTAKITPKDLQHFQVLFPRCSMKISHKDKVSSPTKP